MTIRVTQMGTGQTGLAGLRGILSHPELELVALGVHDLSKAGTDAGDIAGIGPVGVIASADRAHVMSVETDCLADFRSWGDGARTAQLSSETAQVLRHGIDVVAVSIPTLVYPRSSANDPTLIRTLQSACDAGGSSFFTSGIDPGFATDVLPLVLSSVSGRIDRIAITEIFDYSTYADSAALFHHLGFGKPVDVVPPYLAPGGTFVPIRTGILEQLAAGLGVELDSVEFTFERFPAPHTYCFPGGFAIESGTAVAHRLKLAGIIGGRELLLVEHITRMHPDVAPDWPQPASRDGSYSVVIDGSPRYELNLCLCGDDGSAMSGGIALTAMRAVNAIPAVREAEPGLLCALDLMSVTGKGRLVAPTTVV